MTDITLTDNYDLAVSNGDFCLEESLKQSQMLLLETNKGEWKQNPTMGVGVINYVEDYTAARLAREIREQFAKDGMQVINIRIDGTTLDVDAQWKQSKDKHCST